LVFPEGIRYDKSSGFGTARLGLVFQLDGTFEVRKSDMVDPSGFSWNHIVAELKEWRQLGMALEQALAA
jgi:hypothetical protein